MNKQDLENKVKELENKIDEMELEHFVGKVIPLEEKNVKVSLGDNYIRIFKCDDGSINVNCSESIKLKPNTSNDFNIYLD